MVFHDCCSTMNITHFTVFCSSVPSVTSNSLKANVQNYAEWHQDHLHVYRHEIQLSQMQVDFYKLF